jgi:hypothetical protein
MIDCNIIDRAKRYHPSSFVIRQFRLVRVGLIELDRIVNPVFIRYKKKINLLNFSKFRHF